MEYRIPKKGEIYRHFNGNLYEIITIARDSETLEEKVVYKEVNADNTYVSSLTSFIKPVNQQKYPNTTQKFRFELAQEKKKESVSEELKLTDHDMIMKFLDLSTAKEKAEYLQKVRNNITEEFLGIVAMSLDFVENEGSLQERYSAILRYLKTVDRYESGRFR